MPKKDAGKPCSGADNRSSSEVQLRCLLVEDHVKSALDAFRAGGYGYAALYEVAHGGVHLLEEISRDTAASPVRELSNTVAEQVKNTGTPSASRAFDGTVISAHPIWLYNGGRHGHLKGCFVLSPPPALQEDPDWSAATAKFAADQISERISAQHALVSERASKDHPANAGDNNSGELAHYMRLVNLSADLMFIADRNRTVLAVNNSIAVNLGYDERELAGRDILSIVQEKERPLGAELTTQAQVHGMALGRLHLVRKDSSRMPADVFVSYDRKAGVFCVVQRDLSEMFSMERELAERADMLEAQNAEIRAMVEEKERFYRNLSHELRTPITSVIGFAELALDDKDDPLSTGQHLSMTRIADNAAKLLGLLNGLLDLGKLEAGKAELNISRVDVNAVLEQLIQDMNPLLGEKDLALVLDLPKSALRITTDKMKLDQILGNLISNAIKFTESGEVRVTAQRLRSSVSITVSDTGPGISEEELPNIFQEFYQGKKRARGQKGAGLGLGIASKLAELLGGKISVESREGQGSEFTVTLPITPRRSGQARK